MSESYRIVLQPEAIRGMEDGYRFIESDSPKDARQWIDGLVISIESLEAFPTRCPLAPENDSFEIEIRQLLYGKGRNAYRILFTVRGNEVHILHIRHGARKWLDTEI